MLFQKVIFPLIDNCTEQQGGPRGRWSYRARHGIWRASLHLGIRQSAKVPILFLETSLGLNVRVHSWSAWSFHLLILTFPTRCVTTASFPLVQRASFGIRWVIMCFLAFHPILISVFYLTSTSRGCRTLSASLSTESMKLVWLDSTC